MAEFIGNKKDFNRYIGPQLRNLVQQITRKYRIETGQCEHCGNVKNLEAAHMKGKERKELIDKILNDYQILNNFKVDLKEFEIKFRKEHEHIDEVILILCKSCHTEYDSKNKTPFPQTISVLKQKSSKRPSTQRIYTNTEIQIKLSNKLKKLEISELDKYCDKDYCNEIFKINSPLLIKILENAPFERKKEIVRDNLVNRWTWKYQIKNGKFIYAISTQWYGKNDLYVKKWLEQN